MLTTDKTRRDAFTLSLGGMTAIASFAFAPAIAHNRISKSRNSKPARADADHSRDCHSWQDAQGQDAHTSCA
jgi:hypothetical protein